MGRMTGAWRKIGTGRPRGIALLIVLWGLVLLAVIAAAFTTETRTEMALARNLVENAKARALADAGVYRAILGLLAPDVEQRWFADAPFYTLASDAGEVRIVINDEAGKIDLNAAPVELIQGLFTANGVEEGEAAALTAAITDFRDPDDETHLGGGEADDYRAAGLAWGPKNKPFEAVEELHQVLGMSREVYARVAPFVTVHWRRRGIDPVFAAREVLLAVPGVSPGDAEALLGAREESVRRMRLFAGVKRYVALSKGLVYTIRAEARTQGGAVFMREAVVEFAEETDDPSFWIQSWKRSRKAAFGTPSID